MPHGAPGGAPDSQKLSQLVVPPSVVHDGWYAQVVGVGAGVVGPWGVGPVGALVGDTVGAPQ